MSMKPGWQCLQGVTHSETGNQTLSGRLFVVHRRDCFTTAAAIRGTTVIFRKQEASGDEWTLTHVAKYQCHCMPFDLHIAQQPFETLDRCQNTASMDDDFIVSHKG